MNYGSKLSPYDIRDYKIAGAIEQLPETFELDFSNIPVKNQGSVNSCVAHAMSTILEYHTRGRNDLSTNFFYGIQNSYCGHNGQGMYLRDACKIATKLGDPIYQDCPGNDEVPNCRPIAEEAYVNELTMQRAEDFKTKSYYLCNTIEEIKYALVHYGPILASVQWYNDYVVKNGVLTGGNSKDYGYHAIVIYGYNETGFLCQNSWGRLWGRGGRFILPYDIPVREARGLIDVDNEEYISPPKPNAFLNFIYKIINYIVNLFRKKE